MVKAIPMSRSMLDQKRRRTADTRAFRQTLIEPDHRNACDQSARTASAITNAFAETKQQRIRETSQAAREEEAE